MQRKTATCFLACCVALAAPLAQARSSSPVDGLWCGTGLLKEFSLRLAQQSQEVSGTLKRRDRVRDLSGRIEGNTLYTQATKVGALVLELQGDALRIVGGEGQLALARGMAFSRASGDSCG